MALIVTVTILKLIIQTSRIQVFMNDPTLYTINHEVVHWFFLSLDKWYEPWTISIQTHVEVNGHTPSISLLAYSDFQTNMMKAERERDYVSIKVKHTSLHLGFWDILESFAGEIFPGLAHLLVWKTLHCCSLPIFFLLLLLLLVLFSQLLLLSPYSSSPSFLPLPQMPHVFSFSHTYIN